MSYPDVLDQAWAAHLEPPAGDAPTVVSTFAGCGGSSLGYSIAGFRELAAVEYDDHAAVLFRHNFPDVPLRKEDITRFDPASVPVARGELDVFDGSPPCQGLSTAGKRQVDDPRNQLFREYVRLIDAWHPKVLVMENVSGMVKGKMKNLFVEILRALRGAGPGYRVTARLVDASRLGVPQMRQRMIFIGTRADLDITPEHPKPVTAPLTVRQAWQRMPDPGPRPTITDAKILQLVPHIRPGEHGGHVLQRAGKKTSFFSTQRLTWNRPSFTVTKLMRPNGSGAMLHPDRDEVVSIRELARLQSFPDQYDWRASASEDSADVHVYCNQRARIGNSVPPLMMAEVARTVRGLLDQAREGASALT